MFKPKNLPLTISLIVVISLIVGWGVSMVFAWTNPSATPPSNNVAAPINVSSTAQTKVGSLTVQSRIYSNEWIQMNNYSGLYSPLNDARFYPNNLSFGSWRVTGSRNDWQGLEFEATGGSLSLMMGHKSQGWGNQMTGIHNNSYGWLWYFVHGNLYADMMYDKSNTGYYVDPAGLSNLNYLHIATNNTWIPYTGNNQNYIRGIININNAIVAEGVGTIRDAGGGWVRTYGNTGWYNGSYDGGWYMSDGTWIRAYKDKSVYTGGEMQAYVVRGNNQVCIGNDCRNSWPSGGGGTIGGGGTAGYIPRFQNSSTLENSSMSTSGNNVIINSGNLTIHGGLLADYNLSVGGWANIIGQLDVDGTIESHSNIYAHGNILTEGRFYGLLGRANGCYESTGSSYGWAACRDGDYVVSVKLNGTSPISITAFCCGSSQAQPPGGGGGGDPSEPCLAGGTKIKMADGTIKNIEEIKVGEKVLAYDIGQKKLTEQMVLKTSIHPDYRGGYYLIETESGHQLKATGNHPLYVGDSYVLTRDVKPLDILYVLSDGDIMPTRIKSISFISETISVYNFEIEKDQNYFGNEILVHNAAKPI